MGVRECACMCMASASAAPPGGGVVYFGFPVVPPAALLQRSK